MNEPVITCYIYDIHGDVDTAGNVETLAQAVAWFKHRGIGFDMVKTFTSPSGNVQLIYNPQHWINSG